MTNVQRYTCYYTNDIGDQYSAESESDPDGIWVHWEDYERLQTQLLEINKALGLDRDNADNAERVKAALRLRITHEPPNASREALQAEVERLRSALQGLADMYARTWDRVDGALVMMPDNIDRFEKAHGAAQSALHGSSEPSEPRPLCDCDNDFGCKEYDPAIYRCRNEEAERAKVSRPAADALATESTGQASPTSSLQCEHLRSEFLAEKRRDGKQLFEMRKCLDCTKIFRKRLTVKSVSEEWEKAKDAMAGDTLKSGVSGE